MSVIIKKVSKKGNIMQEMSLAAKDKKKFVEAIEKGERPIMGRQLTPGEEAEYQRVIKTGEDKKFAADLKKKLAASDSTKAANMAIKKKGSKK